MSALHCAQLLHIILHITYLLIFALTLQTIIIAPMMSVWGKGDASHCNEEQTGTTKFWFVVLTLQVMVHKTPIYTTTTTVTFIPGDEDFLRGRGGEVGRSRGGACVSYSQWLPMSQQVLCQTDRQSNRHSSSLSRRKIACLGLLPVGEHCAVELKEVFLERFLVRRQLQLSIERCKRVKLYSINRRDNDNEIDSVHWQLQVWLCQWHHTASSAHPSSGFPQIRQNKILWLFQITLKYFQAFRGAFYNSNWKCWLHETSLLT